MILRRTHEMVSGDLSAALARQPSSENTVVSLHTQVADYTMDGERFALLSAWGGRQDVTLDNRRIAVDDDLSDNPSQQSAIVRCEENVLTMVTTQRDVIHRARRVDARRSRHFLAR